MLEPGTVRALGVQPHFVPASVFVSMGFTQSGRLAMRLMMPRVAAATTCWTLSIGVTLAVPGESVTDTTARADTAMY